MIAVSRAQRWTKDRPCPICGGWDGQGVRRHTEARCWGYAHDEGGAAFCSRDELAGRLKQQENQCYVHALDKPCGCGDTHGDIPRAPTIFHPWSHDEEPFPVSKKGTNGQPERQPTAVWDYEGGLRVLRFDGPEGKDYRQQHPYAKTCKCDGCRALEATKKDGDGAFAWGRGRVPLTLYRADELRAAVKGTMVYITEGEKCADRLRSVGLLATTNPGGAGKFVHAEDSAKELLDGRDVTLCADNDLPGKRHCDDVLKHVMVYAASARLLSFPGMTVGYDVGDFVDEGHDGADIDDLVMKQPDLIATSLYGRTAKIYLGDEEPDEDDSEEWILRGIVPRSAPIVPTGLPKAGKSLLMLHAAIAMAAGETTWLGHFPIYRAARVLFMAYEDPRRVTQKRVWQLARGLGIYHPGDIGNLYVEDHENPFRFDDKDNFNRMLRTIDRIKPDIIFLDSLSRVHGADENRANEMRPVTKAWLDLSAKGGGVTMACIHHVAKAEKDSKPVMMLRGSIDLAAAARFIVSFKRRKNDRVRVETDGNFEYKPEPFDIKIIQEELEFPGKGMRKVTRLEYAEPDGRGSGDEAKGRAAKGAAEREQNILAALAGGPVSMNKLYQCGGSHGQIEKTLARMKADRLIRQIGGDGGPFALAKEEDA